MINLIKSYPTLLGIIIFFLAIAIFDVIQLIRKKRTITSWFRQFYGVYNKTGYKKAIPIIPYAVGAVFIGHFSLWIDFSFIPFTICLILFISISVLYIVYNLKELIYKSENKFWLFQKKHFWFPMLLGSIIGCLWRQS